MTLAEHDAAIRAAVNANDSGAVQLAELALRMAGRDAMDTLERICGTLVAFGALLEHDTCTCPADLLDALLPPSSGS